jgi:Putative porin
VKNTVLAAAVAAALTLGAADASAQSRGTATKAEVQSLEAQMKALADRLNRLEAANTELKTQNSELQALADRREAEMDYLKTQTKELREEGAVAANEISKVKGADWAAKIKARGDIRYRSENIWTERVSSGAVVDAADRYRHRIRARLGFDAKVTDRVAGTIMFATGADDPRSSNQTLGSQSTRKAIGLDMAYIDWNALAGMNVVLGKQPWPFWRPGNSLFYDGDYNPEGGAVKFDRGMLFGSAYGWWLSEQYNANPAGENSDGNVVGAQLGLKFPLLGGETRVAAHYYDCGACQDQVSILFGGVGNGNTTYRVPVTTTVGSTNTTPAVPVVNTTNANYLKYDFEVVQLSAEMGLTAFNLPVSLWADYSQNMASGVSEDTGYAIGASIGRASNPKTWNAGLWYQELDADSMFGQFIDSDFGDGRTDTKGFVFRGAYAPVRNFTVQATYFLNTLNKDERSDSNFAVNDSLDYDRLQVDLNYKF